MITTARNESDGVRRFVGWVAVIGSLMGCINLASYVAAVGGDLEAMFKPAVALALSADSQRLFLLSMWADSFGFYLPYLVIGGYFWSRQRDEGGALVDMAAMCIVVYVLFGAAGTSMQIAALPPLAASHAAGDPMVRAATEAAWLAIVHATEHGLWEMEATVLAFWAWVTAAALRRHGGKYALLLSGVAIGYLALFILVGAGAQVLVNAAEPVVLLGLILWQFLTGVALVRGRLA